MASKDYLFINKDSRSPSLSRNTGTEASLASRVNKHVQQQRFWKTSGPRQSWYRPFVRSNSGSSAPSPTRSDPQTLEDLADINRRLSVDQRSPRLPKRSASARVESIASRRAPKSSLEGQHDLVRDVKSIQETWPVPRQLLNLFNDPGTAVDAFKTIVMPLTPSLVEVVTRHMRWATSASVTNYTVKEGVKRVFASILQDKMRAAAFLAVATAQQKKTTGFVFPSDQGPELYSYQATKMIRAYIENHKGPLSSNTLGDIFRLAIGEWMSGNHDAARIHFAYISKLWVHFDPQDAVDYHVWEVCSSEDLFLAIDVDGKPLLDLSWVPRLPTGPQLLSTQFYTPSNKDANHLDTENMTDDLASQRLTTLLRGASSPLTDILHDCIMALGTIPHFQNVDFGSALVGPLWTIKRHMQATLHRLQSLDTPITSINDSIRRSLVIVLFLASTTPDRRIARTNLLGLAERLKESLENNRELRSPDSTSHTEAADREMSQDPGLGLWMYVAGLAATKDSSTPCFTRQWFTRRALLLAVRMFGYSASFQDIERVLSGHLYFNSALGESIAILLAAISSCPRRKAGMAVQE